MAYTLKGRAIEDQPTREDEFETPPAPCIFCGQGICHVNDSPGTDEIPSGGWILNSIEEGRSARSYMYHNDACPERERDEEENPPYGSIWRCGCCPDYTENVGLICASCEKPRAVCTYPCVCGATLSSMDRDKHVCK